MDNFPLTDSSGVCDGSRDCQKYCAALYVSSCHGTGRWRDKANYRLADGLITLIQQVNFFFKKKRSKKECMFPMSDCPSVICVLGVTL